MAESMQPTIDETPDERMSWSKVWLVVVTRPSSATFERILRDPQASPRRALVWVFFSGLFGSLLQSLPYFLGDNSGSDAGKNLLIGSPVMGVVMVLNIAIIAWLSQGIAGKFFGGSGTYARQVYALAAIFAPLFLLGSLIGGIPYVQYLGLVLSVYLFVVSVIATKAVNRIGWSLAAASYIGAFILIAIVTSIFITCLILFIGVGLSSSL